MKETVAIICGGGPAPGINTVISTVAKLFLTDNYRVIGVHDGFKGILLGNSSLVEFDFQKADKIFNKGGSYLNMSRFKPTDEQLNDAFFIENNVKLLVSIGGDDTANTANRLANFLKKQSNLEISNIHVPKTIDNDLPLPGRNPTFGYHSAKHQGVLIGNIIEEDARTTQSWFVLSAMGRSAGHLAFGIGTSCHFPMIIIPELFYNTQPTFDKIIKLLISSIVKRKIEGIEYGVTIISEGVFHILSIEEINKLGINFTKDTHGHPELGAVSKSNIFNELLQKELKSLNLQVKSRPNDLGYELRCCPPIGFDLTLCTLLGTGVYQFYKEGKTGCIVAANSDGDLMPLYLNELQNEEGKILPRLVDIHSDFSKSCLMNLQFLKAQDCQKAAAYLPNPEVYVFDNILNWN